jgi:hypothetical protein
VGADAVPQALHAIAAVLRAPVDLLRLYRGRATTCTEVFAIRSVPRPAAPKRGGARPRVRDAPQHYAQRGITVQLLRRLGAADQEPPTIRVALPSRCSARARHARRRRMR